MKRMSVIRSFSLEAKKTYVESAPSSTGALMWAFYFLAKIWRFFVLAINQSPEWIATSWFFIAIIIMATIHPPQKVLKNIIFMTHWHVEVIRALMWAVVYSLQCQPPRPPPDLPLTPKSSIDCLPQAPTVRMKILTMFSGALRLLHHYKSNLAHILAF